jgi:hypothetical protein
MVDGRVGMVLYHHHHCADDCNRFVWGGKPVMVAGPNRLVEEKEEEENILARVMVLVV